MAKVVILLRVSTIQQDFEQQKEDLVRWSEQLGYEDYVFIEDKESGVKLAEEERLGLTKLKEMVNADSEFKGVIVYELSRLARTTKVLYSMKEYLESNKINLHIFDKKYHLLNKDGETTSECDLLFSMYAYFATDEIKNKKLRTARGRAFAKQEGKFACGKLLYGYTTDKDNYIIPNEKEVDIIKYIVHRYISTDISLQKLGKECYDRGMFNCKLNTALTKVGSIVANKNYYGIKDSELNYPKILPTEWLDIALDKIAKSKTVPRETSNVYWCKGLLRLKSNNRRFGVSVKDIVYKIEEPYVSININLLDSIVWHLVKLIYYPALLGEFNEDQEIKLNESIKINEDKLIKLNKSLSDLEKEEIRLNELYVKGRLSTERYESMYNDTIKNKGIFLRSKTLLEEDNIKLHKALESVSKVSEIDFSKIYVGIDDKRIREIIFESIDAIYLEKVGQYDVIIEIKAKVGVTDEYKIQTRLKKLYMKHNGEWIENYLFPYLKRFDYRK